MSGNKFIMKESSRTRVALCLVSCGFYIHIEACVSVKCLLYLSSIGYCHVKGKDRDDARVSP